MVQFSNPLKTRTCVAVKKSNFMPQLSGNITIVQLKINFSEDQYRDVLIRSVYMPYDSKDLPQVETMIYAEERGLELLLGCDANSHSS